MAQLGERRGIKHGMKSAALAWRGMLEGTINPAKGESMTDQETIERVHVTADDIEASNDLIDFIEACPSVFHTAATIMAELDEAGFTYLPENAAWDIEPGGITRSVTPRASLPLRWAKTWPLRGARTALPATIIFNSRRHTAIRRRLRLRPCPSSTARARRCA